MSYFTLLHYIGYISSLILPVTHSISFHFSLTLFLSLSICFSVSLSLSLFAVLLSLSLSASLSSSSISLFSDLHGARSSRGPCGRHHSLRWGEQGGQEEARGGAVDLDSCYLMMFVVCAVEWCVRCDVRF